jgi:hypothetical protein
MGTSHAQHASRAQAQSREHPADPLAAPSTSRSSIALGTLSMDRLYATGNDMEDHHMKSYSGSAGERDRS